MSRKPIFTSIVINSVDQTAAIASSIVAFNYTDIFAAGGSTLELDILANSPVLPLQGQFIEIKFRYQDGGVEGTTGTMRIDDFQRSYRPDTIKVGAIAWDYGSSGWSRGSKVIYDGSSLKAIVEDNATRLGLTGNYSPSPLPSTLTIGTTTLLSASVDNTVKIISTDSRFALLRAIAKDYGYFFQAKGGILYFKSIVDVKAAAAVATFTPSDVCPGATFRSKFGDLVRTATLTTRSGTSTTYTDNTVPSNVATNITISDLYFEGLTSTQARAAGIFAENNLDKEMGSIKLPGNAIATAGSCIALSGYSSAQNRNYLIMKANHSIDSGGWLTSLDLVGV